MTRFFYPVNVLNVTGVINSPTIGIKPLTFTAVGLGFASITFLPTGAYQAKLDYSRDGGKTWTVWNFADEPTLDLYEDTSIAFRGVNNDGSQIVSHGIGKFSISGNIVATGSVMSIVYGHLLDSYSNLIIPDGVQFTQLFDGCTGLLQAPELPATQLSERCYENMFSGCDRIIEAPILPAKQLVNGCYDYMFSGCTNLSEITVAFTDWGTQNTTQWVDMIDPGGVFKCPAELDTSLLDASHIPTGWTIEHV